MKTIFILIFITFLFFVFGCTELTDKNNDTNTIITNFEECTKAGYPVMESYPRQCSDGNNTFTEIIEFTCSKEDRNVDVCIELYDPVCAKVQVECITAPCPPIDQTFSNSCFACKNDRVISYEIGECKN